MPELKEGISAPGAPAKDEVLVKCDWMDCKTTHKKKPVYPKGGTVKKNTTYAATWVAAGLEPWKINGPGKNPRATMPDYLAETPGANYVSTAAALKHPEYHTQKHHLISASLFKDVSKLSHDAELVGYDVNHKKNGMCLPTYTLDIVQHGLQCHRGGHPGIYYESVGKLLKNLQTECVKFCEMDINGDSSLQLTLLDQLNRISERIRGKILSWDKQYLVRASAILDRDESIKRFKNLV